MAGPKTYDVIILGASGFTGKHLIREALKFLNAPNSPLKSLALAGRSPGRLLEALKWAAGPGKVPPEIPLITADTTDPASLSGLAAQAKIILNCIGPFELYGEPVISACVDAGCDYLDVCGEKGFLERMEALYHDKAVATGSLVVPSAAFSPMILEIGLFFHSRHWAGPSAPNRVEAYWSMESDKKIAVNFGSYKTLVGVVNADADDQLVELRERPRPEIPGPQPSKGSVIERQKKLGLWTLDVSILFVDIIRRMLSTLVENPRGIRGINENEEHSTKREAFWSTVKPAHFSQRFCSKKLITLLSIVIFWNWMRLLGKFALGRWLLLKFPSFFGFGLFPDGPTEDVVASITFNMWFIGHGYSDRSLASKGNLKPDTEVITRVSGPEPGYVATPIILMQCALMLLSDRGNFPKGGVHTPGIVFGPTNLQERLQENGISFELISKGPLSA